MGTTRSAVLLILAGSIAGCAGMPRYRGVGEAEEFQLQSAVVSSPGPGWEVLRQFDEAARQLAFNSSDRSLVFGERDGDTPRVASRPEMVEAAFQGAVTAVEDPSASVAELPWSPDPRFGDFARLVASRAEESGRNECPSAKRVAYGAALVFRSSDAPARTFLVVYVERGTAGDLSPERFEEHWRAELARVELRAVTEATVRAAAREGGDFPKQFHPGLARRSLTLQSRSMRIAGAWQRRLGPARSDVRLGLALGLSDHLQLDTPGVVSYSFGEVEALTRPEFAVMAGLTGVEHNVRQGTVWTSGIGLQSRYRLAADVAWKATAVGEYAHASRTGADTFGASAATGLVWDVHPILTLGLEVGGALPPASKSTPSTLWVGGSSTPLATFHVLTIDLGLESSVALIGGRVGYDVGVSSAITF